MPEGPSIVILKEAVENFKGKTVILADGNSKAFDLDILRGQRVVDFKSWGKHFLICLDSFSIRIHFMLFGSYRINESKATPARLALKFDDGELNFYACSVLLINEPLDDLYDWTSDVMNKSFDADKAFLKLRNQPETLLCDALLDQNIFAGSGNIIKNEVMFRVGLHPLNKLSQIPDDKLKIIIAETVNYSFDFLRWKKEFTLKKHWLTHTKTVCSKDATPLIKQYLGKTNRRTFYCELCQRLYS